MPQEITIIEFLKEFLPEYSFGPSTLPKPIKDWLNGPDKDTFRWDTKDYSTLQAKFWEHYSKW